ncbi:MAG: response regulator [Candidatus Omnitrophica bacterium]|nr:response regulator [Candidatus Omnitrophota bacterium]MCB9747962.1 response regulator [Candidatus Omnitrophota bacterium]
MSKKILIIEDEHYLLELTEHVLKKRGYEITTLDKGEEVVQYAVDYQPNLIILDNLLPDKNGVELCNEIKSTSTTQNIPIILTTGHVMEDSKQMRRYAQPDFILWKPFDIEQLCDKIEELIK